MQVNNCPIWSGGHEPPGQSTETPSSSAPTDVDKNAPASTNDEENFIETYVDDSVKNATSSTIPFVDDATKIDASSLLQLLETADQSILSGFSAVDHSDGKGGRQLLFPADTAVETIVDDADDDAQSSCLGREVTHDGVSMYEFVEYECEMCLLTLLNRKAAMQHLQTSDHGHANMLIVNVYCCCHCSLRYRQKQAMWFHVTYICGQADPAQRAALMQINGTASSGATVGDTAKDVGYYKCSLCCKQFYAINYLQRHIYLHHRGQNDPPEHHSDGMESNMVRQVHVVAPETTGQAYGTTCQQSALLEDKMSWSNYHGGMNLGQSHMLADSEPSQIEGDAIQTADLGPQALLDLACSMVLDNTDVADAESVTNEGNGGVPDGNGSVTGVVRRCAKGIVYKNVFMKCIVNYLCSMCHKDLSTKLSKKEHKNSPCFESGVRHFTYVRHYSYLCPYCSDKFPSQKLCRHHQLTLCLLVMGVKTDDLNFKQLLCPLCDKKYFNIITLKGHMTLVHKATKFDHGQIMGSCGYLGDFGEAPDAASDSAAAFAGAGWTGAERAIMMGVDSNESNDGAEQVKSSDRAVRSAVDNDDPLLVARRQRIRDNARKRRQAVKDAKAKLLSVLASDDPVDIRTVVDVMGLSGNSLAPKEELDQTSSSSGVDRHAPPGEVEIKVESEDGGERLPSKTRRVSSTKRRKPTIRTKKK